MIIIAPATHRLLAQLHLHHGDPRCIFGFNYPPCSRACSCPSAPCPCWYATSQPRIARHVPGAGRDRGVESKQMSPSSRNCSLTGITENRASQRAIKGKGRLLREAWHRV